MRQPGTCERNEAFVSAPGHYRQLPICELSVQVPEAIPAIGEVGDMKTVLQDVTDERLMLMLRALGNPARLQLFHQLRAGDNVHCHHLVETLPLSQSTISEHLHRLREAGLVRGEPHGSGRSYVIDEDALSWLKQAVASL